MTSDSQQNEQLYPQQEAGKTSEHAKKNEGQDAIRERIEKAGDDTARFIDDKEREYGLQLNAEKEELHQALTDLAIYDTSYRFGTSEQEREITAENILKKQEAQMNPLFQIPKEGEESKYGLADPEVADFLAQNRERVADDIVSHVLSDTVFTPGYIAETTGKLDEDFNNFIEVNHYKKMLETGQISQEEYEAWEAAKDADNSQQEPNSDDIKRLIGSGWLKYDIDNPQVVDGQVEGEPVSLGGELRKTLETYNEIMLGQQVAQGLEAGKNPEEVIADLSTKYEDYSSEQLETLTEQVQKSMKKHGANASSFRVYKDIISTLGGRHKLRMAEVAGLSLASSVLNLATAEASGRGLRSGDIGTIRNALLLGMGAFVTERFRVSETQKMISEFIEGKEGIEGVRNDLLRNIFEYAPEISHMNAASLTLNNPYDFESQMMRIQRVAESFPMQLVPSFINFLSSTIYLSQTDIAQSNPAFAAMAPQLMYGALYGPSVGLGALRVATEMHRAKQLAPLEQQSREVNAASTSTVLDMQQAAVEGSNKFDLNRMVENLKNRRELIGKRININTLHDFINMPPHIALMLGQTFVPGADAASIIGLGNAQANEVMAIDTFARSVLDIKPLLQPLSDLYQEIGGASIRRNEGVVTPAEHNISFRHVELHDMAGKPYLSVDNVGLQQGDITLLEGKSGSGKSQFIQLLYGKKPDQGLLTIGERTQRETNIKAYREQIGLKPQEPITVTGSLGVNLGGHDFDPALAVDVIAGSGLDASLFGEEYTKLTTDLERQVYLTKQLRELTVCGSQPCLQEGKQLSGGQKQLLALLRIEYQLQSGADLKTIIIDEPTNHLDDAGKAFAYSLMEKWMSDKNRTIIFATHDEALKQKLSDRINNKIIVEDGKVRQVKDIISMEGGDDMGENEGIAIDNAQLKDVKVATEVGVKQTSGTTHESIQAQSDARNAEAVAGGLSRIQGSLTEAGLPASYAMTGRNKEGHTVVDLVIPDELPQGISKEDWQKKLEALKEAGIEIGLPELGKTQNAGEQNSDYPLTPEDYLAMGFSETAVEHYKKALAEGARVRLVRVQGDKPGVTERIDPA